AAVRVSGGAELADLVDLNRTDPAAALRRFGDTWGAWWRSQSGDAPGQEPWRASDRLQWKAAPGIGTWDNWGGNWKSFDGSVWFRRRVTLTPAEAAEGATLTLGVIDDQDQTFVNGVTVGGMSDWSAKRSYKVAQGLLKPGE